MNQDKRIYLSSYCLYPSLLKQFSYKQTLKLQEQNLLRLLTACLIEWSEEKDYFLLKVEK